MGDAAVIATDMMLILKFLGMTFPHLNLEMLKVGLDK